MIRMLPVLLALLAGVLAASAQTRFPHETSDLRPDPAVRYGSLPNGLRYAILANAEPRQRASLRLFVDVGSLQETESQRGVAHFLEHMAFNGSKQFPPGTLIEFFQRMGMNFGGDTNASTGFDRTIYMLELPETKGETLAEGIKVLRDYSGELLLQDAEIERERGIIQAEKRTRDSVDYRSFVSEFEFVLGDSLFSKRMPIGTDEVIRSAPRQEFVDFYNTWYRPERMAVIAVGDFEPAVVEQQIVEAFSSLVARAPARPEPDLGSIASFEGVRVKYHAEPEAAATTIGIQTLTAYSPEPDTSANRLKYLPRDLAVAMVNRRLAELAKLEGASFSAGRMGVHEGFDFYRNAGIELTCQPAQWAAALSVADQELRRALQHGFQEAELREVVAGYLNSLEQAVKTAPTRRSSALASGLLRSLADEQVFTAPADDLTLFQPALASVTVEHCLTALRAAWDVPHRYVSVFGNAVIEGDAERALHEAYAASLAIPVTPPAAIADVAFAYTDFGPPGTVATRQEVEDLGMTLIRFANGVRLNLKPTDFEAGRIRMSVRVGGGQLTEPRDQPGLGFLAGNIYIEGGLGKHSSDDLRRILAGHNVGTGFTVSPDAFVFSGQTTAGDLLLQLQLSTAYLTDPGYRPEAERLLRRNLEQMYARLTHTPQGPLQLEVSRLLAGGDPRFGTPLATELAARNLNEVRTWLAPQLETGAIEIALVGDFEPDAAIAAVAATYGALPVRSAKPAYAAERRVPLPAPFSRDYTVTTEIPKGMVALYWPTTDARDVKVARRLSLLGEVFADRLRVKVREELGGAYSPGAGSNTSDTYHGYGYMIANITVDPGQAGEIAGIVTAIADDLARNGVTDDELNRARLPILTSIRESARTNPYWIGAVAGSAQEFPQRLDWSRTRTTDFETIPKEDVDALAKAYLGADRAIRIIVLPATAGTS